MTQAPPHTEAPLQVEHDGGLAILTLNRPRVRNAIDLATARALAAALDELDDRADLKAGVLTGAGAHFSAGMDLKAFSATGERPLTDDRGAFGIVERPPTKPLIAAVEGPALGGGLEIALSCDIIVAGRSATFGLPEVRRGLVAAAGGVLRLAHRLPRNLALELVMSGEPISAERAHALGLVNRVVDDGDALAVARTVAAMIGANAPLAVATSKALVDEARLCTVEQGFAQQREPIAAVRNSADAQEGARAFVEKRAPHWTGR